MIYVWLILFLLLVCGFWTLNFVGLPGNWLIVVAAALWVWLGPERFQFPWEVLIALLVLAIIGEIIEFAASVWGAKKAGGSSRGATLAVVGSIVGGVVGAVFGIPIPIPVVGILVASVLFAALGAMAGAMIGEYWIGKPIHESVRIGRAAFVGRLLGTVGKITMGTMMLVIVCLAPFIF